MLWGRRAYKGIRCELVKSTEHANTWGTYLGTGASINPMMRAAQVKFVIQTLLFASADANERDGKGNSPLRPSGRESKGLGEVCKGGPKNHVRILHPQDKVDSRNHHLGGSLCLCGLLGPYCGHPAVDTRLGLYKECKTATTVWVVRIF